VESRPHIFRRCLLRFCLLSNFHENVSEEMYRSCTPVVDANTGVIYGGSNRPFESVRSVIRFVMEDLPVQQRPTAEIRTEAARVYKTEEIAKLYRSAEFKKP
jgi:hypothetical protein